MHKKELSKDSYEVELSEEGGREQERGIDSRKITKNSTISNSEEFALLLQGIAKDMEATEGWRDRVTQSIKSLTESVNKDFEESKKEGSVTNVQARLGKLATLKRLHLAFYKKAYIKFNYKDRYNGKIVNLCDVVLDKNANNIRSSERVTHILYLTKEEILDKQKSGVYNNIDLPYLQHAKEEDRFPIYEVHIFGEDKDKDVFPYIVVIDKTTEQMLAITKNWIPDINEPNGGVRIDYFAEYIEYEDEDEDCEHVECRENKD